MLKQLTEAQKVNEATGTKHIPRALSVSTVLLILLVYFCSVKFCAEDYP